MAFNGENGVDEGLYSRQLYVMGTDGMRKLQHTNVLISGLDGLGLEIAKNVVLGGVKSVTLHDPDNVSPTDLSSNYYVTSADIGKPRASVCQPKIAELNHYVQVNVLSATKLTPKIVSQYQVVVLTRGLSDEWRELSEFCHKNSIKIIASKTCGLFGQIFCDFGDEFVVTDGTGEEPHSVMIQSIEKVFLIEFYYRFQSKNGAVVCLEETRHGFFEDSYVTFSEVQGMTELNGCAPRKITVIGNLLYFNVCFLGPDAFSIGDTSGFSEYKCGGVCTEVKMPEKLHFEDYSTAFLSPEFLISDFGKCDRPGQLHLLFEALNKFQSTHKRLPAAWDDNDAKSFVQCVRDLNESLKGSSCHLDEINESLAITFCYICAGECCPLQSVIGGIAAQEVMKACTGRFRPIKQWFYFDAIECLPAPFCKAGTSTPILKDKITPKDSRYEGQCRIFGSEFQEKLGSLKYFIVGAGAIGCELLKNFSMMGVACGSGQLFITDMDTIEKSNLNRQFLFRPWDIQKCKSMNIVPHENRVGPETEAVYDDAFFEALDGVANALDNVEARTYIDRRCVYYRKPLLESGTLGTKCNVQVVIPHLTESYSSSQDPPEKSIPMCTLKNFPYQIEHTLQWARDTFEGLFSQQSQAMDSYIQNPTEFLAKVSSGSGSQPTETLETLKANLVTSRPKHFDDCIVWARNLWQEFYTNSISQLLFNFPADHKTTTGTPFWSGTKRCPHPLNFDVHNPTHLAFIVAAANIRAFMYSLPECRDADEIARKVSAMHVPEFVPRSGIHIDVTDAEMQSHASGNLQKGTFEELRNALPKPEEVADLKVNVVNFEKDDDSNFHMDFITAASNLRAENYCIPPADRLKSKLIAGKIMPAIATTTSLVAGLVSLELYKLVQGNMDLELFKNSFVNLALPFFAASEPMPPEKWKYYDKQFTIWDRFELEGTMTLQEFLDYFKEHHKLDITMLSQDVSMLYSFFMPQNKRADRLKMKLPQLVESVSKKHIAPHVRALVFELCATDLDGEDVDVPYVRYVLNSDKST
ncbi:unnamed protein product [Schistocephalus solidus]|uniref:E1 ubiquitin-activating enzyme n=1 Tax=Schistocephalus solidus TaxID=70667 RepID=A0A183T5M0_SCHSO|nr:unnamed protein product [Schistocephalus solidus]